MTQSYMRKGPVMSKLRHLGLDVHAASIAVAVAESSGDVRLVGDSDAVELICDSLRPPLNDGAK